MKAIKKVAGIVGIVASVAGTITGNPVLIGIGVGATALSSVAAELSNSKGKVPSLVGNITEFRYRSGIGAPVLFGRTYYAGNPVHRDAYPNGATPTPNPYLSYVIEYSTAGPLEGLEAFQADRETVTFSAGAATGKFAGYMWLDTQLGATPEASALTAPFAGIEGWDASSKMSGHAAVLWTLKFDAQDREGRLYAQGEPEPGAIWKGVLVYDPRKDSTYPGGSGSHRLADPSTWEWSQNPPLIGLQFVLGWWHNGKKVAGAGMDVDSVDVASFVEAANVADANSWTCGGVFSTLDDKWSRLKDILQAGGAEPVRLGGMLSCIVQTPRVSIATITEDDILGESAAPGTTSRRRRKNSLVPTFVSEDHEWETVPGDPVTIAAYVTEDGGLREEEYPLPYVQVAKQAEQLTYYEIVNRRELPLNLDLKPRWLGYKPGDCVTTEAPKRGHTSQKFIVRKRKLDPVTASVNSEFISETDAKHAAALALSGSPPPTPSLTSDDMRSIPTPEVGDWTVTGETLSSPDGSIPALVAVGGVTNTNISTVMFQYRVDGETVWTMGAIIDASVERQEFPSVTPGTDYEVAVSYISSSGVLSDRRVYGPVTVGSLVAAADAATLAAIATAEAAADAAQADATTALADLADIASDSLLTPDEKPRVIQDRDVIVAEQSGIDAQATAYGITTEKTAYDDAVTALIAYLATLTTPTLWSSLAGNTTIVGATFRSKFTDVYTARQALLDEIVAVAKALADAAQADADTAQAAADAAQADADTAQAELDDIASDSKLTASEKIASQLRYEGLIDEQAGIDAEATANGVTTEKTAYDNAVTAIKTYLKDTVGVLNGSYVWTDTTGTTTITRMTWNSKWGDVYDTRQALLNAISSLKLIVVNWGGPEFVGKPGDIESPNLIQDTHRVWTEKYYPKLADGTPNLAVGGAFISRGPAATGVKNPLLPTLDGYKLQIAGGTTTYAQLYIGDWTGEFTNGYSIPVEAGKTYLVYRSVGVSNSTNRLVYSILETDNDGDGVRDGFYSGLWYTGSNTMHEQIDEFTVTANGMARLRLWITRTDGLDLDATDVWLNGFAIREKTGDLKTMRPPEVSEFFRAALLSTVEEGATLGADWGATPGGGGGNILNLPGAFGYNYLPGEYQIMTEANYPPVSFDGGGSGPTGTGVKNQLLTGDDAFRMSHDGTANAANLYLTDAFAYNIPLEGNKRYLMYCYGTGTTLTDMLWRVRLRSANGNQIDGPWNSSVATSVVEVDLSSISSRNWRMSIQTYSPSGNIPTDEFFWFSAAGIHEKTGDLLTVPTPDLPEYLRKQLLATVEENADETLNSQLDVSGAGTITIQRDSGGTPKSGQFSIAEQFTAKLGDTVVTEESEMAWALAGRAGMTETIDAGGAGGGLVTISAATSALTEGPMIVTGTYTKANGTALAQSLNVAITFKDDAVAGGISDTDQASLSAPLTAGFVTISSVVGATVGSGGEVTITVTSDYAYAGGNFVTLRVQRSADGSSGWTTIATGSAGSTGFLGLPPTEPAENGAARVDDVDTRTAAATEFYRVQGKLDDTDDALTTFTGLIYISTGS